MSTLSACCTCIYSIKLCHIAFEPETSRLSLLTTLREAGEILPVREGSCRASPHHCDCRGNWGPHTAAGTVCGGQYLWWAVSVVGSVCGGQHPGQAASTGRSIHGGRHPSCLMQPRTGDTAEGHRGPEQSRGGGWRGCPIVGVHDGSLLWESRERGAEDDAWRTPAQPPAARGWSALPMELVTALFVVTMISPGPQFSSS